MVHANANIYLFEVVNSNQVDFFYSIFKLNRKKSLNTNEFITNSMKKKENYEFEYACGDECS